jgi:hypothetical protein
MGGRRTLAGKSFVMARGVTVESILVGMTRFEDENLTDSEFRECDLTRARLIGVVMQDATIEGLVSNLVVNGVEVSSYVEAELDRRHPVRPLIRSADPPELLRGSRELRVAWSGTLERLRRMPNGSEHRRVGGEWSAVETLRHLVFVHDCWFRRCCLGSSGAPTAFGSSPTMCLSTNRAWTVQQPQASTRPWPCGTCRAPSWIVGYRP